MTKEEYWNKLCKKNSAFNNDYVKLSTKSLKQIVDQAYELGLDKRKPKDNGEFEKLFSKFSK